MAKRGEVVKFRKRTAMPRRYRGRPFAFLRRMIVPAFIAVLLVVATGLALVKGNPLGPQQSGNGAESQVLRVTWVDGDSGRLDGQEFRLHGVDAPEGSPDRAKCVRERTLSGDARNAARTITDGKAVRVTRRYGTDSYGRELVDLSVSGNDVADQLIAAGKLKPWNFEGGERKPDWC